MTGTNRKEMRKLLNKYIALMKLAFDNRINMDINTRLTEAERPWFVGHAYLEGSKFTDKEQEGASYVYFTCYEWRTVEGNEEQLKAVERFIEAHMK